VTDIGHSSFFVCRSSLGSIMTSQPVASRHHGVQYLYMLASFVVVVAGMKATESILNPLLLAVFLSVICAPAYFGLLRRGISQWLAMLIVAGSLCAVASVLMAVVMESITRFTERQVYYQQLIEEKYELLKQKPRFVGKIESWLSTAAESTGGGEPNGSEQAPVTRELAKRSGQDGDSDTHFDTDNAASGESVASPPVDRESVTLEGAVDDETLNDSDESSVGAAWTRTVLDQFNLRTVVRLLSHLAGSLGNLLSSAVLIMLTVVFILLEASSFEAKLARAFPRRADTPQQAEQMVHNVQRYMAIKTTVSVATAILIGLWLRVIGVPYISLWMLLTFLLNFIPNIGSIVAAVPAVLIAWLELGTMQAMGCAAGYIVVNMVIGNFLEPRFMGRGLGLSPLVIFCSMVFWGWVLGPVGMLLSAPLTMTVHIMLNGFDDTRWIATLMGGTAKN